MFDQIIVCSVVLLLPETPETPDNVPPTPTTPTTPRTPTEGDIEIPNDHIPQVVVPPKNGKIELTGKHWKFTPKKGFYGKDKFTVRITPPTGDEYEEEIEIDIPIPEGITSLPKTGGFPALLFFLLGSACLVSAVVVKKK